MNKIEKEVLEIEESFKDTLENDIKRNNMQNKEIEIKDIKLIGKAIWKDKISGNPISENVFIVEKQIKEINEDGKERITEQNSYYLGDRCIGGAIGNNEVVFNPNFESSELDKVEAIKKLLERTSYEEIEANSLNVLRKKEILEILSAHLGRKISEEEVEKILDEMDKDEVDKLSKEEEDREDKDEGILSEKQVDKIKVKGIQKADLNKIVDGKETLGKRLDLEEYDSIYIVYSENAKEVTNSSKINNTTYSLVGMAKGGQAKVLNDEFEMDKTVGNSGSREQTKVRADGTATRDNKDLSVYTRKSNGMSIGCENSQGNVQMFLYQKTLEENENVGIQIETSKTPVIQIETREIMNRDKGVSQKDKIQNEIEEHTEEGCNPTDIKDFDGISYTQTHIHLSEEELNSYVEDILNYENDYGEEKVREIFTENEVREKLLREINENEEKSTLEEIIENVKDEMNKDAEILSREHKL